MSLSLIIFLTLVVVVIWLVLAPILKKEKNDYSMMLDNSSDSRRELQTARSKLMLAIKEMDFDYETGKLSKEDYKLMRAKLEQDTIDVLKKIEIEDELWVKFENELDQKLKKK